MLEIAAITPTPPKQHRPVTIHHGQGGAFAGRGPGPGDFRGGPCPYDKIKGQNHWKDLPAFHSIGQCTLNVDLHIQDTFVS